MFPPLDIGIGYAKLGLRAMHLPIFNIIHGDWHLIRYQFLIPSSQTKSIRSLFLSSKHPKLNYKPFKIYMKYIPPKKPSS